MKIHPKQFQELTLLTTGCRISLDFEGCYILLYNGIHLYRCSETIILMSSDKTGDTVKIELSERMEIMFDNELEIISFCSILMKKITALVYSSFLDNIYTILKMQDGVYHLVSDTFITKCVMEVK